MLPARAAAARVLHRPRQAGILHIFTISTYPSLDYPVRLAVRRNQVAEAIARLDEDVAADGAAEKGENRAQTLHEGPRID